MIYSKRGASVRITAYCGKQKVEGYPFPMMLVKAIRMEDLSERFYLASMLEADDGIDEVFVAIDAAPELSLSKAELKVAIAQVT